MSDGYGIVEVVFKEGVGPAGLHFVGARLVEQNGVFLVYGKDNRTFMIPRESVAYAVFHGEQELSSVPTNRPDGELEYYLEVDCEHET